MLANAEVLEGNSLAVKHTEDVVIRLNQECRWIGKRLIIGKPFGFRVAMGTENRQIFHAGIEPARNGSRSRIRREQSLGVQHGWKISIHSKAFISWQDARCILILSGRAIVTTCLNPHLTSAR